MTDATRPIVVTDRGGPGFLVRIVWYVLVGWWLSGLAIVLAWLLAVTIIGLPLAFMLFNRIPAIMTLRGRTVTYEATVSDGVTYLRGRNPDQRPLLVRAVWFVLIGWWLGGIWMFASWIVGLPIITLPLSVWMMNRVGGVMTLLRYWDMKALLAAIFVLLSGCAAQESHSRPCRPIGTRLRPALDTVTC